MKTASHSAFTSLALTEAGAVRDAAAPVRVLLLTDTAVAGSGGSERFLRSLLAGLDSGRHRVDLVQLSAPADGKPTPPRDAQLRGRDGEFWPIAAAYGPAGLRCYTALRRRMLRGDYDIIQSQHEKSDLMCALLPRGPTRATRLSNRRDSGFQKSPALRAAFRLINPRFDWVLAPSRALIDGLQHDEGVAPQRCRHLPNGVDAERFAPWPADRRQRARLALGLPDEAFVFGCVARLVPVKRHQDLIEAFAKLASEKVDSRLLLIGAGECEAALRAQVHEAGLDAQVQFLGERRDVDQLLPLLDAFVLCSATEGMSNALLEAMACGLPVIASAVGGNPETLQDHLNGLLVPAAEPLQLAAAMRRLLRDRPFARDCGRRSLHRIEQHYSVAAMVAQYEALYRDCRPR